MLKTGAGFPINHYYEARSQEVEIGNFRVRNWHRPFSAYMECFLALGLRLVFFDEPLPTGGDLDLHDSIRRVPPFVVLEWKK